MSAETLVADLEAVVDQAGLERFALGGIVLGGATAMMYAARHPEKVSHPWYCSARRIAATIFTLFSR